MCTLPQADMEPIQARLQRTVVFVAQVGFYASKPEGRVWLSGAGLQALRSPTQPTPLHFNPKMKSEYGSTKHRGYERETGII